MEGGRKPTPEELEAVADRLEQEEEQARQKKELLRAVGEWARRAEELEGRDVTNLYEAAAILDRHGIEHPLTPELLSQKF